MEGLNKVIGGFIRSFHIYNDLLLGLLLAGIGGVMLGMSFSIKEYMLAVSPLDTASFFPQLVAGILIIIGLVLFFRGIKTCKTRKETAPEGESLENSVMAFRRGSVALISIALFIAFIPVLGFIPSAIIYMLFSMFFMAERDAWKPWIYVITAVLAAVAIYFLFRQFVYVHLPDGILKGVLN